MFSRFGITGICPKSLKRTNSTKNKGEYVSYPPFLSAPTATATFDGRLQTSISLHGRQPPRFALQAKRVLRAFGAKRRGFAPSGCRPPLRTKKPAGLPTDFNLSLLNCVEHCRRNSNSNKHNYNCKLNVPFVLRFVSRRNQIFEIGHRQRLFQCEV